MIRAVESVKKTGIDVHASRFDITKAKKRKHKVRKDYYNNESLLFFVGFLLLLIAAFIFITIGEFTSQSHNLLIYDQKPKTEKKPEIVNTKDSESKDMKKNVPSEDSKN